MVRGRGASHCRGNRTRVATARGCKSLGAACGDEYGAPLAFSWQVAAGPRTARSGLRLVRRRLRHARSERGKGVACRVGLKEEIEAERLPTASGVDLEAPDPRCCSANCESDVIFLLSLQDGWLANFIFRAIPVCDSLLVHALRPANTEIAMAQGDRLVDNGVNVEALLAAREALTDAPEGAQFKWRAACEWKNGTHSHSTVEGFYGLGKEQQRKTKFTFDADHPEVFRCPRQGRHTCRVCARRTRKLSDGRHRCGRSKPEHTATFRHGDHRRRHGSPGD